MRVTLPDRSCPKCGSHDFYSRQRRNGSIDYQCVGCRIEYNRNRYRTNKQARDRDNQRGKQWYQRNKTKVAARVKQYRKDNADEHKKRSQQYYVRTRDKQLAKSKQRKERSPQNYLATLFNGMKFRSKKRNLNMDITKDHLASLWESQNGACAISGKPMAHVANQMNTVSIDRIDSSKGYIVGNIQLVCKAVNYAKNTWGNEAARQFFGTPK